MEELWKDIKGYEGLYQVSNKGNVKSLYSNRLLKPRIKENFYMYISLYKDKKDKKFYVHRLVADAFIPNPHNKEQVNHKNFDKKNNCVENLEWVSQGENFRHYQYSSKWNSTYKKIEKKISSRTIAKVKDSKEKIIKLYKKGYTINDIAREIRFGRDFVSDVLYLYDII